MSSSVIRPRLNSEAFLCTLKSWSMVIALLDSMSGISSVTSVFPGAFVRLNNCFGSESLVAVILLRFPLKPYVLVESL